MKIITGLLFKSQCQTYVNSVNCVGVMGAGIALEFRLRYPKMYRRYVDLCNHGMINIGKLWIYESNDRKILNFPTKKHWKDPSREEYLVAGLKKFLETYKEKGIESVAFPVLGSNHGGMDKDHALSIMHGFLNKCTIPVEVYQYDPIAEDDLYSVLKEVFDRMSDEEIRLSCTIRKQSINSIRKALEDSDIRQMSQLANAPGIGISTLEKAYKWVMNSCTNPSQDEQLSLDL